MDKTKVAITGNIHAPNKTVLQEAVLLDKPHTILPAVMMVSGAYFPAVESINKPTSLYFSSNDLKQSVLTWNGRPVSYNHPNDKDTCNSPETFNKQWVGYVFNTRYEEDTGSLKAELWIDNERGKSITNRIKLGDQIDVSIGAFGDLIPPVLGNKEVKSYDLKMTNIVGDHLAVLPDGEGACNWKDGCGIRASVFSFKKDRQVVYNKQEVKLAEMSDCTENKIVTPAIARVEPEQVNAKETIVEKKFSREEWLSQAPDDVKDQYVNAMNNYESAKQRHISSIIKCEDVKFCKEELGRIKDVTVLEGLATLVNSSLNKPEEVKEETNQVDYQLRSVAASKSGAKSESWAGFNDIDYSTVPSQGV